MFKKSISLLIFVSFALLFSQREPDPNVGNTSLRRMGTMDGSLVRTIFINWGELAHWPDSPSGEWPKGSGHQYVDGVALVVQARTIDNKGVVIYPMETQYREFVDRGPQDQLWGWGPLPGYFNHVGSKPAISNDPASWPSYWPDKADGWVNPNEVLNDYDDDGNGLIDDLVYWNGFFGKGVFNADLETFFVFDDDPDEEWDFYPDPTDLERRGLGLEVAARYFQWSQVLAEDVIFAVYFITNEGKTDYDSTYYSFYIDWGIGGTDDSSDDTGDYDTKLDIAWAWDGDGLGSPNNWSPVGVAGFAFLESPGIDNDFFDNDEDGLIDETRVTDGPGQWLDAYPYGVDDVNNFVEYYKRQPGPHWSNDEDGDWLGFYDGNGNGEYDPGEQINDDVGMDGLGPNSFGYPGPDEGEADGMPTPGEPNFDYLDKDEADQIGLTGFRIFPVHTYELWNERQNWEIFRSAPPPTAGRVTANLGMFFSSGPFPLAAGETENYSMALLFGINREDLVLTKNTIQQIYNADYRFAKPPDKPKITSISPGDGKVTITWDSRAEDSWDPFIQKYDFEGYRIYRSTEKEFLDTRVITDAYGRATYGKPIAQFDLKNGLLGLHPIDIQGARYNLGEDNGLQHYYIDTDVKNGVTYYYAIVSFDQGLVDTTEEGEIVGIPPSECPSKIDEDAAGNITVDINTAYVVPGAPAAGFTEAGLDGDMERNAIGTGAVDIEFILPDSVINDNEYSIVFGDTTYLHDHGSPYFIIYDITNGANFPKTDTVWIDEYVKSPIVDGFVVSVENHEADINYDETGWVTNTLSNYRWRVSLDIRFNDVGGKDINTNYPADFLISFSNSVIDTADNRFLYPPTYPCKFTIDDLTEGTKAEFMFQDTYVVDSTLSPFLASQETNKIEGATIWVEDPDPYNQFGAKTTWRFYFEGDEGVDLIPPAPNDSFLIVTKKPFRPGDEIRFKVQGEDFSKEKAKNDLDKIVVVPNPYLATATWETKSLFRTGRGERKIYFINLPPKCTIRIYTVRGYLVDTIEHNTSADIGQESWNLLTKDGLDVAYGVYIFHVDAPGIGEKIGKFAVIK